MTELARLLIVSGLVSGTQPSTIMGLLVVMNGATPRRNGWAFVLGLFTVETLLLVVASVVLGGTIEPVSIPGRLIAAARIVAGLALLTYGLWLRRPSTKPSSDVPPAFERLKELSPTKSFVAAFLMADYVGPVLGSIAIATSSVGFGGRLVAIGLYTLLAAGIPLAVMLSVTHSPTAQRKLADTTDWVMRHRRPLASWLSIVVGTILAIDGAVVVLSV